MTSNTAIAKAVKHLETAGEKSDGHITEVLAQRHINIADRYIVIAGHLRQSEYDKLTMANPGQ